MGQRGHNVLLILGLRFPNKLSARQARIMQLSQRFFLVGRKRGDLSNATRGEPQSVSVRQLL